MNQPEFDLLEAAIEPHLTGNRTESSALLAWVLENVWRMEPENVDDSICDGGGDKGIDALYVDDDLGEITIFQSKHRSNPDPTQGDRDLKNLVGAAAYFETPAAVDRLLQSSPNRELTRLLIRLDIRQKVANGAHATRLVFVTNARLDAAGRDYVAALADRQPPLDVWDRSRLAAVAGRTQRPELLPDKVTLLAKAAPTAVQLNTDALRVERLQFPDDLSAPLPKRRHKKTAEEVDLNEAIAAWPGEEQLLWGKVVAFQEAVQLISRRYLGGEDLLFPQSAHRLQATLDTLADSRDIYRTVLSRRPPQSEAGFLRWVLEDTTPECPVPPAVSHDPAAEKRPDTRATARSLAEHHVLMARAEALEALGERDAGIRLVEDWLRSQE